MSKRIMIVDDSMVAREMMKYIFESDPDFEIVGVACDGFEAVKMTQKLRPDLITMDIHMPGMDGFDATRQIMETIPTPIIIVSSSSVTIEVSGAFKALEAGALTLIDRPVGLTHPNFEQQAQQLRKLARSMADVPVVRRWNRKKEALNGQSNGVNRQALTPRDLTGSSSVLALGASTGGPMALETVLRTLSKPFPLPVLMVQHISRGFLDGFVDWLAKSTGFPVEVAQDKQELKTGVATIAPDGYCMAVDDNYRIHLDNSNHPCTIIPSVAHLFDSVCDVYGADTIAVLMTGMGRDGAQELLRIRKAGGITFAQNEESSVVFGMPGEAVRLGAAEHVLNPLEIGNHLNLLASKRLSRIKE